MVTLFVLILLTLCFGAGACMGLGALIGSRLCKSVKYIPQTSEELQAEIEQLREEQGRYIAELNQRITDEVDWLNSAIEEYKEEKSAVCNCHLQGEHK